MITIKCDLPSVFAGRVKLAAVLRCWLALVVFMYAASAAAVSVTSVKFSPSSVAYKGTSTLSWTSNAQYCVVDGKTYNSSKGSKKYTGLTATKTVKVTCSAHMGGSAYKTAKVTVAKPPAPPTTPSISYSTAVSSSSTVVSWGASSSNAGVSGYKLYQQTGSGSYVHIYTGTSRSRTITGLIPGTYRFRVRAYNSVGHSSYRTGSTMTVVVTSALTVSTSTSTSGNYSITWTATHPDGSPQIWEKIGSGSWKILEKLGPSSTGKTTRAYSRVVNGTYSYKVDERIQCQSGTCLIASTSPVVTVVVNRPPVPSIPSSLSASVNSDASVQLSWGASSGTVTAYQLDSKQQSSSSWSRQYSGTSRSVSKNGFSSGYWDFRVRACNTSVACSGWRSLNDYKFSLPELLQSSTVISKTGSYQINWSVDTFFGQADLYEDGERIQTDIASSGNLSLNKTLNADYVYLIKNYDCRQAGGPISPGTETNLTGCPLIGVVGPISVEVDIPPPSMPTNFTVSASSESTTVGFSWDASTGSPDRYMLSRSLDQVNWENIYSGSGTSVTISDFLKAHWHFKLYACKSNACGATTSASADVGTTPAVLSVNSDVSTSGRLTFNWSGLSVRDNFYSVYSRIYKITASGEAVAVDEGDIDSYKSNGSATITETENGVYTYVLQQYALVADPGDSHPHDVATVRSNEVTVTVDIPIEPEPTSTLSISSIYTVTGKYSLSWSGTEPYSGGTLYEKRNNGDWVQIKTISPNGSSSLEIPFEKLINGTFSYKVQETDCRPSTIGEPCIALSWSPEVTIEVDRPLQSGGNGLYGGGIAFKPSVDLGGDRIGSSAGQFRVDESGSATYSMPFSLPAGNAGVAPQLAMNYSSQAGNGLLGKGWSLSGLSAVSRCRQTLAQDGVAKRLSWNANDRFCLDGQKLVLVAGTSYGAVNAEYRTEIDSFAKVTSQGGELGKPASFKVERKDGSVSYYGVSTDSKQKVGAHTLAWALSEFRDSVGEQRGGLSNSVTYHYQGGGSTSTSGFRIAHVDYAYSGSVAQASAVFNYETRPDDTQGYLGGYKISSNKRLKSVDINNGGVQMRHYELYYYTNPSESLYSISHLEGVQECVGTLCLPGTSFEWTSNNLALSGTASGSSTLTSKSDRGVFDFKPGDFNGDGFMDLVWIEWDQDGADTDHHLMYAMSNGSSLKKATFTAGASSIEYREDLTPGIQHVKVEVLDYNADGRQDIAVYNTYAGKWRVHLSVPNTDGSWQLSQTPSDDLPLPSNVLFADINSDGLVDAVEVQVSQESSVNNNKDIVGSRRWLLQRNSEADSSSTAYGYFKVASDLPALTLPQVDMGDISFTGLPSSMSPSETSYMHGVVGSGDFDGDGQVDALYKRKAKSFFGSPGTAGLEIHTYDFFAVTNNNIDERRLLGQITINQTSVGAPAEEFAYTGDLNGDGLTDIITQKKFYLSTGTGLTAGTSWAGYQNTPQLLDYNADGYTDVLWHDASNKQILVSLWNDNTLSAPLVVASTNGDSKHAHIFLDLNGDNSLDRLYFNGSSVSSYLGGALPAGESQYSIRVIENGLGNRTQIKYGTLSQSGHYQPVELNNTLASAPNSEGSIVRCVAMGFSADQCEGSAINYTYAKADTASFYSDLNHGWGSSLPQGSQFLEKASPVLELNGAMPVVTSVSSSAPMAGNNPGQVNHSATSSISYHYTEAKLQAAGRGFLGFRSITTTDEQSGVKTTTRYRQDFPFIGYPLDTQVFSKENKLLSAASNTWKLKDFDNKERQFGVEFNTYYQPYLHLSEELSKDLVDNGAANGAILQIVTTESTYDDFGNTTKIKVVTSDGGDVSYTKTTDNVFGVSEWDQRMGRLSHTTVSTQKGIDSVTRESSFTYYGDGAHKGLLASESIVGGLTTDYLYDDFGNKIRATQTSGSDGSRYSRSEFDINGRYLVTSFNAAEHRTEYIQSRDPRTGAPTKVIGLNNAFSEFEYDEFGRQYLTYNSDGSHTITRLIAADSGCPQGSAYMSRTEVGGGAKALQCFDVLGRTVREGKQGFDGRWSLTDNEYDNVGRLKRKSSPFFIGESASYWAESEYDILGRVTRATLPDDSWATTSYEGYSTTISNQVGSTKTEVKNVLGQLVRVSDNLSNGAAANEKAEISYDYDLDGNLQFMHSHPAEGGVITTELGYDALGRKTSMSDPDKGYWIYDYNDFGELEYQRDAKGQVTEMHYDILGRMEWRKDKAINGSLEGYSYWYYDKSLPNAEGIRFDAAEGQVTAVVMSYGSESNTCTKGSNNYCKMYNYDDQGRLQQVQLSLPDSSDLFVTESIYGPYGRVVNSLDALSGKVTNGNTGSNLWGTENRYNEYGYLASVVDINTGKVIREVTEHNVRGQLVGERRGNGAAGVYEYHERNGRLLNQYASVANLFDVQRIDYQWDDLGNLTNRHNTSRGKKLQESFCYDKLNRLVKSALGSSCGSENTISYDSLGNITYKQGVGFYSYNPSRPHAVASTSDGVEYHYDANGNMTSDTLGSVDGKSVGGRTLTYSSFDKPLSITRGNTVVEFDYGPSRSRYKRVDRDGDKGSVVTTHYLGGVERITSSVKPSEVEWRRQLDGETIFTVTTDLGSEIADEDFAGELFHNVTAGIKEQYIYRDHLGSTDVITDVSGIVQQQMSFDPWGARREASNWQEAVDAYWSAPDSTLTSITGLEVDRITRRGFTGHEMVDSVGIIHMNGRIYDARIGRFLQADPHIQAATNTQSLNRYSYVLNNPLNMTDPTGYWFVAAVAAIASTLGVTTTAVYGAVFMAVATTSYTHMQTGSWSAALKAGLSSFAFSLAGAGATAWAFSGVEVVGINMATAKAVAIVSVYGGITSVLQGGKFGDGFKTAGLTVITGAAVGVGVGALGGEDIAQGIARIVVGGTMSEATGGKFANGALMAAFAWATKPVKYELPSIDWSDNGDVSMEGDDSETESFSSAEKRLRSDQGEESMSEALTVENNEHLDDARSTALDVGKDMIKKLIKPYVPKLLKPAVDEGVDQGLDYLDNEVQSGEGRVHDFFEKNGRAPEPKPTYYQVSPEDIYMNVR